MAEYELRRTKELVEAALAHKSPKIALIKLVREAYREGLHDAVPASTVRISHVECELDRLRQHVEDLYDKYRYLSEDVNP